MAKSVTTKSVAVVAKKNKGAQLGGPNDVVFNNWPGAITISLSGSIIFSYTVQSLIFGANGIMTLSFTATSHGWGSNSRILDVTVEGTGAGGSIPVRVPVVFIADCNQHGNTFTYGCAYDSSQLGNITGATIVPTPSPGPYSQCGQQTKPPKVVKKAAKKSAAKRAIKKA